jgi:hypothetical protein
MVHYSPYDPHGGIHDGPLVTGASLLPLCCALLSTLYFCSRYMYSYTSLLLQTYGVNFHLLPSHQSEPDVLLSSPPLPSIAQTTGSGTRSARCIHCCPWPTPTT